MGNVPVRIVEEEGDNAMVDYAVHSFRQGLREIRSQKSGSNLEVLAWVINDELAKVEVESLIEHLQKISSLE